MLHRGDANIMPFIEISVANIPHISGVTLAALAHLGLDNGI